MTIAQTLKKYPLIETDLLLGHILKQPKEFLYMNGSKKLTAKQVLRIKSMIEKRQRGMPAAYLLGYKHFYGLKFKLSKDVLIPRPETEWLVDEALKITFNKLKQNSLKKIQILDVGTGSGAIAVSIAHEIAINNSSNKVKIFATDISKSALKIAQANAKALRVKVSFSKHDLLKGVKGKFDIIIANLPYVPVSVYEKLYGNLKFEPKIALTDGYNGSTLILKLLKTVKKFLNSNGVILLEVDPSNIKNLKLDYKLSKLKVYKDIRKLNRYIKID